MGGHGRRLGAVLAMTVAACGDPLGPVRPEEVSIIVGVGGGIDGSSFTLEVDGGDGVARGLSCSGRDCFEPGAVLLPLSAEQVAALALRFERAGVFGLDGRDFGNPCCDGIGYDLTYVRGDRSSRVVGDAGEFPDALRSAVGYVSGLAAGWLPVLVSPDTDEADWPFDPYALGEITDGSGSLTIELGYPGGCAHHRIDLVAFGRWIDSSPPRIDAVLTHDAGGDTCERAVTEQRRFNLRPLLESHERRFGPVGGRPRVILQLRHPGSTSPVGRLVEVVL